MAGKIFALNLEVPGDALGNLLKGLKSEDPYIKYNVTLEVPESELGNIISSLTQNKVRLLTVNPTDKTDDRKKSGYAHGIKNKGISGSALILQLMENSKKEKHIWTSEDFSRAFVKHNFAGGSWGPPMSALIKEKRVLSIGQGKYCLPGTTVNLGDIQ